MIRAAQRCFKIAQHDIQPLEWLSLCASLAFWRKPHFMMVAHLTQHFKPKQSVRRYATSGYQRFQSSLPQYGKRKPGYRIKAYALRPPLPHFDCSNKRHFVFRTPPGFTASTLAAKIGVINSNITLQGLSCFTLSHRFHQFVLEQPSRFPADADVAHQCKVYQAIQKTPKQTIQPETHASLLQRFVNVDPLQCLLCKSPLLLQSFHYGLNLAGLRQHHAQLATLPAAVDGRDAPKCGKTAVFTPFTDSILTQTTLPQPRHHPTTKILPALLTNF